MKKKEPEDRSEDQDAAEEGTKTPGSAPEVAEVADIEALVRERDEATASWKRAAADYQNLRRRLQTEVDEKVARQKTAMLAELLLVLDYLDMALSTPVSTEEGKSLHAGVEATRAALLAVLEREGIRPLPDGGPFDPAVHESVAWAEAGGRAPGEIVEVLRRGYTLDGRILRPAQVKVAGEKPETD